jgi:hypothetical protein
VPLALSSAGEANEDAAAESSTDRIPMWITIKLSPALRNSALSHIQMIIVRTRYQSRMSSDLSSNLQSNAHSESLETWADKKRRAIAPSSDLGRKAFVFDEDEVVNLLRAAVDRQGSQIAFADHYGVDRANVSAVLNGRRRITGSLIKALGLRKVYSIE